MGSKYHIKINLERIVDERWPLKKFDGMFKTDAGSSIPAEDARRMVYKWYGDGLECGPPCDNQDEKGNCRGHEQPTLEREFFKKETP